MHHIVKINWWDKGNNGANAQTHAKLKGAEANLYTFSIQYTSRSIQICFRTLYYCRGYTTVDITSLYSSVHFRSRVSQSILMVWISRSHISTLLKFWRILRHDFFTLWQSGRHGPIRVCAGPLSGDERIVSFS